MDKHVNNTSLPLTRTEEQLDWVRSLEPTHINLVPDTVAPVKHQPEQGDSILICGITRIGKSRLAEELIAGSITDER